MTDTVLLSAAIERSGAKKTYIAERLGISLNSLANKSNNVTEFKPSEITTLCDILGITSLEERDAIFFAQIVYL